VNNIEHAIDQLKDVRLILEAMLPDSKANESKPEGHMEELLVDRVKRLTEERDTAESRVTELEEGGLYKIKPLPWPDVFKEDEDGDIREGVNGYDYIIDRTNGVIKWEYCFDEYYDEGGGDASSIEEAVEATQKHWRERVLETVIEVEGPA
jgi:hypothetical protein